MHSPLPYSIFGKIGKDIAYRYEIQNESGFKMNVSNYGATILSLEIPDKNGKPIDIVWGFDSLQEYDLHMGYVGGIVGRSANRIANGKFDLNGKAVQLTCNENGHHLHGGFKGFNKVFWEMIAHRANQIVLSYLSQDGEEGYPGNLTTQVTYTLSESNSLQIEYKASCDQSTPINLTSHPYFNLSGSNNILKHNLQINADCFLPTNEQNLPSGILQEVTNTPFDFRNGKLVGANWEGNEQIQKSKGYDHSFVLNKKEGALSFAAKLFDPVSKNTMEVWTNEPAVHLYTANLGKQIWKGKVGKLYPMHGALCLETQHFPNSPNETAFPSTILKPGEIFNSITEYRF